MKNILLLLLINLLFGNQLFAQTWVHYSRENTMQTICSEQISKICVDVFDNVWIGTGQGISKYDGSTWTYFNTSVNLPSNWINAMESDPAGNLWIGTGGGLTKFDGTTWITYTTSDGLLDNLIKCIEIDDLGNIWIGTDSGAQKFDGTTWTNYTTSSGLCSNYVNNIGVDALNNVWICTTNGLSKYDGSVWLTYTIADGMIGNNIVQCIDFDTDGTKWIGTSLGLSHFNDVTWVNYTVSDGLAANWVIDIEIDIVGNKWISSVTDGISKFDNVSWTNPTTNPEYPNGYVNDIALDNDGHKWFVHGGVGAVFYDDVTWTSFGYIGATDDIYDVAQDTDGTMWFAALDDNACKFNGTDWISYTGYNDIGVNYQTNSVFIDHDGVKWFGGSNFGMGPSVTRLETTGTFIQYTEDEGLTGTINAITEDAAGNKWFAQGAVGVTKYDGSTWTNYTTADGLNSTQVRDILVDSDQSIWVATMDGVNKFNGSTWTAFTTADGLVDNMALCISKDAFGNKWIGTYAGLSKFDGVTFTNYTMTDGLASNEIVAITIDALGVVWVGTAVGISKFDGTTWTNYTIATGPGFFSIRQIFIDEDGAKWVATYGDGVWKFIDGGPGTLLTGSNCTGVVFVDDNGNGIMDGAETGVSNQIVTIEGNYTVTQNDGMFYQNLTSGPHTFTYSPPVNWVLTTPASVSYNVTTDVGMIYFGIAPTLNIHDLEVNITCGPTRANFEAYFWVNYSNNGTLTEDGTVTVVLDPNVTYVSSSIIPSSITGNVLTWDFTNLGINDYGQIAITTLMPDVDFLGNTFIYTASITPVVDDLHPVDNYDTLSKILTGSYDPNFKATQEGVNLTGDILIDQYLTYTIHFQNTGTDTAFNVNIYDTISENMDLGRFEFIGSSHTCNVELRDSNIVIFHFYNILLPDSIINPAGSNGYVQYRIYPNEGLTNGTTVLNTGYIYFDYNPAIVTNTSLNTYVNEVLNTESIVENEMNLGFVLYPNPAQDQVTIYLQNPVDEYIIEFINIYGQDVKKIQNSKENLCTIPLTGIAKGTYIVKLTNINRKVIYYSKLIVK